MPIYFFYKMYFNDQDVVVAENPCSSVSCKNGGVCRMKSDNLPIASVDTILTTLPANSVKSVSILFDMCAKDGYNELMLY